MASDIYQRYVYTMEEVRYAVYNSISSIRQYCVTIVTDIGLKLGLGDILDFRPILP